MNSPIRPTVVNIPRLLAKDYDAFKEKYPHMNLSRYYGIMKEIMDDSIWISITEPHTPHIESVLMENNPNIKLKFWDVTAPKEFEGVQYDPPEVDDAIQIVDFILANPNKNVVANCAAGISRSGAIAQFCEQKLGYFWPKYVKELAYPNHLLYRMMVEYYDGQNIKSL